MATNNNPGNFANDRDRASEAGQKGGQNNSTSTRERTSESGRENQKNDQTKRTQGES